MNISNGLKVFFSSLKGLNRSSETQRLAAWKKFGWHALSTTGFDFLILWNAVIVYNAYSESWKQYKSLDSLLLGFILLALAIFFSCRYFFRFIISWKGWRFRNLRAGFFMCDRCHKLKPARYLADETIEDDSRTLCESPCLPEAKALHEKAVRDLEAKQRMVDESIARLKRAQADLETINNTVSRIVFRNKTVSPDSGDDPSPATKPTQSAIEVEGKVVPKPSGPEVGAVSPEKKKKVFRPAFDLMRDENR